MKDRTEEVMKKTRTIIKKMEEKNYIDDPADLNAALREGERQQEKIKLTEEDLKETMNVIVENRNKELYSVETREELLKKYFHFDFEKKYESDPQRLRAFVDAIELLKHFAKDWEKEKHGFTCCVDRVYIYFINPLCKKYFEENEEL